jgi:predicted membrane-bound dolichyl-phosphate-mannose-protein mannosyltransferase
MSPDRGVSLVMMKIYSVFGLFQWVYLLGDETNFIFLRSESPPGSATMGSEFDVP